ncbi:MAG: hypothetical protein NVSMB44_20020 [Ktedonobacteraceae bacterium]
MVDYIGRQLGNYQLTRLIGEGAFARVYLGEHIYLGTQAAIKVLNAQSEDYSMDWFRTEARTIARLVHPNIVRVLEFGVVDTTPFLVLDYAPNGALRRRHPDGTLLPLTTVVSYVKQAAEALQYVHDEKLIHRDVKPENLLLGRRNEVLLSDFGIALMMQTFNSRSVQNVAGTVMYIAPEQMQGRPCAASDQYSLGIIAYEWLAGSRPFDGSAAEIISQQIIATPPSLTGRVPTISPAVEQVVMKALEKDPAKRFASVRAFAQALEQASQLAPPLARPTITSAPVGEIAIVPPPYKETIIARTSDVAPVRSLVPPVLPPPSPPPISGYNMQVRPVGTIIASYRGHLGAVRSLAWSPDSVQIVSASNEKSVHVWQAMTGNRLQLYQDYAEAVRMVAWSSDGSRIASVGIDSLVRVWDFASGHLIIVYRGHMGSTINTLAWSPRQHLLASAASDATVHVWDATTGQTISIYRGHASNVNSLAWSPNRPASSTEHGYYIVSGSDDATVQTWDAFNGQTVAIYRSQPGRVVSVAWSPDIYPYPASSGPSLSPASSQHYSARVGSGREDGMIKMWDTTSHREVLSYRYVAPIRVVAWSPNGRRFAYASANNTIEVWDTSTNLKLATFSHAAPLHVMTWSPDGRYIASGGEDATIQVRVAP